MKPEHEDLSNGPKQNRPVEIGYFSLVGFDDPERENGVEGAFLGVKSSEAVRVSTRPPSQDSADSPSLNTSNSKTEPETPTVTLMYSRADGALEWEIRLFRRFQDEFYLTRRELQSQDTGRFQPAEFRIEPAEYFDVLDALRHVQVPIVPAEVPLRLGPYARLSIRTTTSDVTFSWSERPSCWEPLALVVEKILRIRWKYSQEYD